MFLLKNFEIHFHTNESDKKINLSECMMFQCHLASFLSLIIFYFN